MSIQSGTRPHRQTGKKYKEYGSTPSAADSFLQQIIYINYLRQRKQCKREPRNADTAGHLVHKTSAARVHHQGHGETQTQVHETFSGRNFLWPRLWLSFRSTHTYLDLYTSLNIECLINYYRWAKIFFNMQMKHVFNASQ